MERNPEELVHEFFSRVWSPPNDLEAIDELMTEDYEITTAGNLIKGRAKFKEWVGEFHKVLLDAKNEHLDVFSNEEKAKVVSRWVCSGRNNGIMGTEPDQRQISFTGIALWHVREGRLSACWVERSALELYKKKKK